jgi:hypothetical protein
LRKPGHLAGLFVLPFDCHSRVMLRDIFIPEIFSHLHQTHSREENDARRVLRMNLSHAANIQEPER